MTKSVRIENADTSPYKVVVRSQSFKDGEWVDDEVYGMPVELPFPSAMTTQSIWKGKRLIIQEAD